MKAEPKHYLATIVLALFIILTLSAYHGGPATGGIGNQTGSPGAGNCSNCHNGGADTTFSTISIRKKGQPSGDSIRYYTASETYVITIRGRHSSYTTFGYQMLLIDSNNTPNGKFTSFGSYGHGHPQASPNIAENYTRIPADTTGWFEDVLEWQSPAKSSGRLTLYAIVNAVDNDGKPSNDKAGKTMSVTLQDSIPRNTNTSIVNNTIQPYISIYPNPANTFLHIQTHQLFPALLTIYNTSGKSIYQSLQLTKDNTINTTSFPIGTYFITIKSQHQLHNTTIFIIH